MKTFLQQLITYFQNHFTIDGKTYSFPSIPQINQVLRVAQIGKITPAVKKLIDPVYHPLLEYVLAKGHSTDRERLAQAMLFLNAVSGYSRLVDVMITEKAQPNASIPDLAKRMAFIHRAMSHIGQVEAKHSLPGVFIHPMIDKEGYTTNPKNVGKARRKESFPARKGHGLLDQIWIEAVHEGYYKLADQWDQSASSTTASRSSTPRSRAGAAST